MKKRICIISLSLPIELDIRTIKQVEYLSSHYAIVLIGHGDPERILPYLEAWKSVNRKESVFRNLAERGLVFAGKLVPSLYDVWYWQRPRYQQALSYACESSADAFLASDWATIPIATRAAEQKHPVVFDADEYWTSEVESNRAWKLFFSPLIAFILRKYTPFVSASTTVSNAIAQRYHDEYGLNPILVYNAPKPVEVAERAVDPDHIHLIHQGSAIPNRRLENLIVALALADRRFVLHLMLVGANDDPYMLSLKQLANNLAPDRVTFQPPVYPTDIVQTIAQYDIGISVIPPATATYRLTLPNKIFESIMACQPVVVGPSPAMMELIRDYDVGWVTDSFSAQDLARTLNALTLDDINAKRHNAREAAKTLNADVELGKMIALFDQLLR